MTRNIHFDILLLFAIVINGGCQLFQSGTEIRTDEQMLPISYENDIAENLFTNIVNETTQQTHYKVLLGTESCHLYSESVTIAFNAHCNDHIKAMDKNEDLIISQREAEDYYQLLSKQGKISD